MMDRKKTVFIKKRLGFDFEELAAVICFVEKN